LKRKKQKPEHRLLEKIIKPAGQKKPKPVVAKIEKQVVERNNTE